MGSSITEERNLYAALNNCAFVSTDALKEEPIKPFLFMMDMSMLGVGVGFDTKGAGTIIIKGINKKRPVETFVIPDSREGWVDSLRLLLDAYFHGTGDIVFDYTQIREEGAPIKGFGGRSSGYKPLEDMHIAIRGVLDACIGEPISLTAIVDIMNLIGTCVVSGNVRRTAEISFGDPYNEEYLDLKNYAKNPHREAFGWTSNNSIFAELGMNYKASAERTIINGEPGYAWLENMQNYSRMNNGPDFKDHRAKGGNPCLEQTLESFELCCLVETFPCNHDSLEDYIKTLKYAYLYAKTVTLGETHWAETNRVMLRNRRIGCSMSGIAQFIQKKGLHNLREWCEKGYTSIQEYDKKYSDWLAIPRSIKTTSIKPSGTVSLLVGATPGCHYSKSRFILRRVTVSKTSNLIKYLEKAGYEIEQAKYDESSFLVSFPIDMGEGTRTVKDVSVWEKTALAAFLQRHWADNQVSCTVEFDPITESNQIEPILNYYQYQLKGISFLPNKDDVYEQMPYEEIDEKRFKELNSKLKKLDLSKISGEEAAVEKFCDGDKCII